jgi:hypothetical protein
VEFFDLDSMTAANARYPDVYRPTWSQIPIPITAVEVRARIPAMGVEFGARESRIGGGIMRNCLFTSVAIAVDLP